MKTEQRDGNGSTTMDCGFADDVKAYLDNELTVVQRARLKMHLAQCSHCRQMLEEMEQIGMDMKKLSAAEAALEPEMRTRLLNGLHGVEPDIPDVADRKRRVPLWRQKPLLVFGGGGATVVAAGLAFMTLYSPANEMQVARKATVMDAPVETVGVAKAAVAADAAPMAAAAPAAAVAAPAAPPVELQERARAIAPMENAAIGGQVVREVEKTGQPAMAASASVPADLPTLVSERQVHREAALGVAVTSVEQADNQIVSLVESTGGFVASNNLNTDESGYKFAELSIKVPVKDFDSVLASVAKLGDLRSKSLTGEDITERVSDATSDEQLLKDETEKLTNRLKEGGMSEKRIGQTEAELREVRLQLARTRARLGLLRKMSSLSTIQISLTEKAKKQAMETNEPGFLRDMRETNRAAMTAFQAAVRVPIVMIVWVLAFSPLWIPLILAYRWASLRNGRKHL